MDAAVIRSRFQKDLFSRFQPSTYAKHVGLAAARTWLCMPKWQDDDTVEFNIFRVSNFASAFRTTVSNIMIIIYIVKWCCHGVTCNWCVLLDNWHNFSLNNGPFTM